MRSAAQSRRDRTGSIPAAAGEEIPVIQTHLDDSAILQRTLPGVALRFAAFRANIRWQNLPARAPGRQCGRILRGAWSGKIARPDVPRRTANSGAAPPADRPGHAVGTEHLR